ncbi:MAG: DNA mismatch repair protein MutS [Bacteroidales bacterium]|nr:DNA mismatch repair protein MutS [Bacteroidales bacterium]
MSEAEKYVDTPLMKQYYSFKSKHPDAILLFRVGDFYETFGEDAIKTSEILGITLTRRANGAASFVELAGFPYHALDNYLYKLVRAGQRVAICEQLEDPKLAKKIVKRGITDIITPGVTYNDNVLERKENNFIACVHFDKMLIGVAFLDVSTGEFYVFQGQPSQVDKLLGSLQPKELLCQKLHFKQLTETFGNRYYVYKLDDWMFTYENSESKLIRQFQVSSLKGFGISDMTAGIIAAGVILQYLEQNEQHQLSHITSISRIEDEKYLWLDKFTIRNLELFQALHEGGKSLIDILDHTQTPMGGRMLKRWLAMPLKEIPQIQERHEIVDWMVKNNDAKEAIEEAIRNIGDIERFSARIATLRASPREVYHIKKALESVATIISICQQSDHPLLKQLADQLNPCPTVQQRIEREILPDAALQVGKGSVIADGVNAELDELRRIRSLGKEYLQQLQQREIERTGIPSLKISYNNVFGYYIEVRNTHKDKVPPEWIRKQTLVGAERYITPELKEYEEKILGAEEKIVVLENTIFQDLLNFLSGYVSIFQQNAQTIARLDCLCSFATVSVQNRYVRPVINDSLVLDIKAGRHPVIEKQLPPDKSYVANDIYLDTEEQQIIIITGPNMSGKSAILRQTALIVIMAQIGCFIPADAATIGVVDKVFTRVGASDNISLGESTFMIEMIESASILNNLSPRSLVLLDEIGRGTSTYDGISIAWAMVEYIHEHPSCKAKTLFATHYHELNEMEKTFPRIKNYNVSVREVGNRVIFLHKLVPGGSEHSFGIHVAKMAGMPQSVVHRAEEILKEMEMSQRADNPARPSADIGIKREGYQLSIFQLDDPVLKQIRDELKKLDINNLTPLEALNKLNYIKRLTGL